MPYAELTILFILAIIIGYVSISNNWKLYYLFFPFLFLLPTLSRLIYGSLDINYSYNVITIFNSLIILVIFIRTIKYVIIKSQKSYIETFLKYYIVYIFLIPSLLGFANHGFAVFIGLFITITPMAIFFVIKNENIDIKKLFFDLYLVLILINILESVEFIIGIFPWDLQFLTNNVDSIFIESMFFDNQLSKNISNYSLTYPVSMLLTFSLINYFENRKIEKIEKIFILSSIFLFGVTLERTPLIAILVGLVFYFIFKFILFRKYIKVMFLASGIIFAIFFFQSNASNYLPGDVKKYTRIIELTNPLEADNIKAREIRWESAYDKLKTTQAIFGYGIMYSTQHPDKPEHRTLHSELFNQIIEFGYMSLFFIFGFIILLFYKVYNRNYFFAFRYFAPIVVFVVLGAVNSPFLITSSYFFWLFSGLIAKNKSVSF